MRLIGTHYWWLGVALMEYWKATGQPEYLVVRMHQLNDFCDSWSFRKRLWFLLRYPLVMTKSYFNNHMADAISVRED